MVLPYWTSVFLVLVAVLWVLLYIYVTRNFNHWKRKKIPFVRPVPFFGNAFKLLTMQESVGDLIRRLHESTTGPFVGFFVCDTPLLLVRDPELVRTILVKDFEVFDNRAIASNERDDMMGSSLVFIMKNPKWREMRRKITPIFTSGKLKAMFRLIARSAEEMVDYIGKEIERNPVLEMKEVAAKYTTDTITSVSFGYDGNCFKDEDSEFRKVSRRVFNWDIFERAFSTSCYFVAPTLVRLLKLKFLDKASADFLREVFWKAMNEREQTKFVRNDLIDHIIEMKKNEDFHYAFKEGDRIVGLASQFFIAGFDTTSSTIIFTLYELSRNKDVQETLRSEIREMKNKHGRITYACIQDMKYMSMCIKETLRKFPSLPFLDRVCNVDYQIPGTDIILEKGTPVFIANWALQFDPKYFPDPEKYDPTRFSEENMDSICPATYLPFGEGPRACLGLRFGTLTSCLAVAYILSNFEVSPSDKNEVKLDNKGILLSPLSGLHLRLTKLSD